MNITLKDLQTELNKLEHELAKLNDLVEATTKVIRVARAVSISTNNPTLIKALEEFDITGKELLRNNQ